MDAEDLQQMEELLRSIDRKAINMIETASQVQTSIKRIKELLKPIHLLTREGGGKSPSG